MSQNDFTIANQGFPAFRADLNSALQALASNNSGAAAPSTTFANMWWYDTTNNIMYIRNEDNDAWIKFAELDQANDKFVLSGTLQLDDGTVSAPALTFNSDTNMGIYRGGTDILKFVTAGTDAITINASQDVGIGIATPQRTLHLNESSSGSNYIHITNTTTGTTSTDGIIFGIDGSEDGYVWHYESKDLILGTNNQQAIRIGNNGTVRFYEDTGTTPKFLWDPASETLGVGTTSGSAGLTVETSKNDNWVGRFENTNSGGYGGLFVTAGSTSDEIAFEVRKNTSDTALKILGDGNVLVGTTTDYSLSSTTATGIKLSGTGTGAFYRDGGVPLYVNRGEDGTLINLRVDGSLGGIIGVLSTRPYIGKTDTALFFNDTSDAITPYDIDSVSQSNGVIDLGTGTTQFKDLFLSGGVVFGSTGGSVTSKTLDDYEEGSFTVTLQGGTTSGAFSYPNRTAYYVKVGNLVTVTVEIEANVSSPTPTGRLEVAGLPFTCNRQATGTFQCNDMGSSYDTNVAQYTAVIQSGQTVIHYRGTKDDASNYSNLQAQSMGFLRTTITYEAQ